MAERTRRIGAAMMLEGYAMSFLEGKSARYITTVELGTESIAVLPSSVTRSCFVV
jgi:hypothetical protein